MKELVYTAKDESFYVSRVDRITAQSILRNEITFALGIGGRAGSNNRMLRATWNSGFTADFIIEGDVLYVVTSEKDPEQPLSNERVNAEDEGSLFGVFKTEAEARVVADKLADLIHAEAAELVNSKHSN